MTTLYAIVQTSPILSVCAKTTKVEEAEMLQKMIKDCFNIDCKIISFTSEELEALR